MKPCLTAFLAAALFMAAVGCGGSDPIVVFALHPKNSQIIYVATNDYIYKTRDGGQTWENISRGMSHSRVISMAIDPVYPTTVYAGTKGDAVFKSYDGGQRWTSLRNGLESQQVTSVVTQFVFDPKESSHLFVSTTLGVYESKDGGEIWQKRMDGMTEVLMVVALALDPSRPQTMYAGTSGGVYKSVNAAGRWEKANNGLLPPELIKSSRALGVTVMQVDPFAPDTVYAATLDGLYKTTDGAVSWTRIAKDLPDQMISAMVLDRAKAGRLYIASREGIHKSEDGGKTWAAVNQGFTSLNIRSLAQSPLDPNLFYAGTNGSGLYKSVDRGTMWMVMPPVKSIAQATRQS
jgi:photosystem II stability/assembly factor-like uncharacterized protein